MKKSLTLLLVLFLGSTVQASVIKSNLGLDVLASKAASVLARDNKIDINLNDDLNLDKSYTAYEIYAGVNYDKISVRGYHFLPKNQSGSGILRPGQYDAKQNGKADETIQVTAENGFKCSRIEVGTPIFYQNFVVEPFFVNQWVTDHIEIKSNSFNYNQDLTSSTPGGGLLLTHSLSAAAILTCKWFQTSSDKLFDVRYTGFNPSYFWSVGYTHRTFNLKSQAGNLQTVLQGPVVQAGLIF
ncbi:MAG: hypothetical protein ACP5VS_17350 [Desulfomonilaceae bacterium]